MEPVQVLPDPAQEYILLQKPSDHCLRIFYRSQLSEQFCAKVIDNTDFPQHVLIFWGKSAPDLSFHILVQGVSVLSCKIREVLTRRKGAHRNGPSACLFHDGTGFCRRQGVPCKTEQLLDLLLRESQIRLTKRLAAAFKKLLELPGHGSAAEHDKMVIRRKPADKAGEGLEDILLHDAVEIIQHKIDRLPRGCDLGCQKHGVFHRRAGEHPGPVETSRIMLPLLRIYDSRTEQPVKQLRIIVILIQRDPQMAEAAPLQP